LPRPWNPRVSFMTRLFHLLPRSDDIPSTVARDRTHELRDRVELQLRLWRRWDSRQRQLGGRLHERERLGGRRLSFCGPLADSFIRTEPVSMPLQAEQSQQPTRVVNDGEATSTAPLQCCHRILERLVRADDTTSDGAKVTGWHGARDRLAQIVSLDGGEQLTVRSDDESYVDVVVVEQPPDLGEPRLRSVGLADRYHDAGDASLGVFAVVHFPPSARKVKAAGRGGRECHIHELGTSDERGNEHTHGCDPLLVDGFA